MQSTRFAEAWEPFACPVAGRAVYIHRVWRLVLDSAGREKGRIAERPACEYQDHCVIASYGPDGITHDWARCAFTQCAKAKSA